MRNLLIALFVVLFALSAFAQGAAPVVTEFSGIVEVSSDDTEAEPTIILDMGEKTYILVVADAAKRVELEGLAGSSVTVKGELLASTDAEEFDTIKVESWEESAAAVIDEESIDDEPIIDDAPDAE